MATLARKEVLKAERNKVVKVQAFNPSYFCSKSHFEDYGTQFYLAFQPIYRFFKKICDINQISVWKCLMKVLNPLPYLIIVLLHH